MALNDSSQIRALMTYLITFKVNFDRKQICTLNDAKVQ